MNLTVLLAILLKASLLSFSGFGALPVLRDELVTRPFEIDANGIMHVRAKDLGTGKAQSMRVISSSGLSDDEVTSMIADADTYRGEDSRRRQVTPTASSPRRRTR